MRGVVRAVPYTLCDVYCCEVRALRQYETGTKLGMKVWSGSRVYLYVCTSRALRAGLPSWSLHEADADDKFQT